MYYCIIGTDNPNSLSKRQKAAEPYLSAGVYADVSVRPYKGVFLP